MNKYIFKGKIKLKIKPAAVCVIVNIMIHTCADLKAHLCQTHFQGQYCGNRYTQSHIYTHTHTYTYTPIHTHTFQLHTHARKINKND